MGEAEQLAHDIAHVRNIFFASGAVAETVHRIADAAERLQSENTRLLGEDRGGSSSPTRAAAGPSDCAATAPACQSEGDQARRDEEERVYAATLKHRGEP